MTSLSVTSSNSSSIPAKKKQAIFSTLKKWSKQAAKSSIFQKNKPELIYPFYHLDQDNCNNPLASKNYSHTGLSSTYRAPTLIAQDPERFMPLPELSPSQESNISPNSISSSPKESLMYLEGDIHANSIENSCDFRRLSYGDLPLPISPDQLIPESVTSFKSLKLNESLLATTLKRNSLISQSSSGFESSNLSDDEDLEIHSDNIDAYCLPQGGTQFDHQLIARVLTMAINNNPEESLTNYDIFNPHQFQNKSKKKNKKKLTLRNSAIAKSLPLPIPNVAYPTSPVSKSYKSKTTRNSGGSGRLRGSFSTKSLYDPNINILIPSGSINPLKSGHASKPSVPATAGSAAKTMSPPLIVTLQDSRPSQTPFKRFNHSEDTSDITHYQAQHTFWLVKQLKKTIANGGYLTSKLFVPAEAWRLEPSPLKNLEQKIQHLQKLSYHLVFMDQINMSNLVQVSDATVSLNIQLTSSGSNNLNWTNTSTSTFSHVENFRLSFIPSSNSSSNTSSSKAKKNITKMIPQSTNGEESLMHRYRQELLQFLNACHTLERFYNHFQSAAVSKGYQLGVNPICFLTNSVQLLNFDLLKIIREDLLCLLTEYLERYREDIDY